MHTPSLHPTNTNAHSVDFTTDTPGPFDSPPPPPGTDALLWSRFQEQAAALRARVPGLFDPSRGVRLMTEVGWALQGAVAAFHGVRQLLSKQVSSPELAVRMQHPHMCALQTLSTAERPLAAGKGGLRREPSGVHQKQRRAA